MVTIKSKEQIGQDRFCKYLERKRILEDRLAEQFKRDFDLDEARC